MTVFAVMTAGLFPILHTGRPWKAFWLIPYANWRLIWPQFKSPLVWDVFAISTYLTISTAAGGLHYILADHPQLLAELSRLTRDWIAYAKRPSDGVVAPATFVMARRVGPYWRSQLSLAATDKLPARELVVLTRAEPAVAPGDEVGIVGLAVDDDVVWASDLRPAAAGAGFPGL
jgi:hypothetical protein